MVLHMARPWKYPKSGVYYLRVRVPRDLVTLAGRALEKRSLGTKDVAEARARFAKAMADLSDRWANLRKGLHRPSLEDMNFYSGDFYRGLRADFTEGHWSPFFEFTVGGFAASFVEKTSDEERWETFRGAMGGRIDAYFAERGIQIAPQFQKTVDLRMAGALIDALGHGAKQIYDNDLSEDAAAAKYKAAAPEKASAKLEGVRELCVAGLVSIHAPVKGATRRVSDRSACRRSFVLERRDGNGVIATTVTRAR